MSDEFEPTDPRDPLKPKKKEGPKDPFEEFFQSFFGSGELERRFHEIQRALENMARNVGNIEPGKPYVAGFSLKVGPDGVPRFEQFGNKPVRKPGGIMPAVSDEREPLTDVIESEKDIAVTLEIPGVEKKDIRLEVLEEKLEVSVDNEKRKYHKVITFPATVVPDTAKATYTNGVLDVTVQKKKPGTGERRGHRVPIQ